MAYKWKPTIGTFSKGAQGSVTCNFSENGSCNCSNICPLKGNGCYGETIDKLKPSVYKSGVNKRLAGFQACAEAYINQLEKKVSSPWVRFSAFGSPSRLTDNDIAIATKLLQTAKNTGPIHFPVECPVKFRWWNKIAKPMGITIRISMYSVKLAWKHFNKGEAVSLVWGEGDTLKERTDNAKQWSREHKGAMFCPAIGNSKIKCGEQCKACANGDKLIIYPKH